MSRNFDLLAEIERERDASAQNTRAKVLSPGTVVKEFVPQATTTPQVPEMLRLVQNLFLSAGENGPRQVVFCGVDEQNGSSSVCAQAGRTLAANTTKAVCLIDANVRSANLSRLLGGGKPIAFSPRSGSLHEHCMQLGTNLWLAESHLFSDSRGALLPVEEFKHRLKQLESAFDYLLIDAPGVGASRDAMTLGRVIDAAILVLEAGRTRRMNAARVKEALEDAGVRLLGTVLHDRSFPIPEKIYRRI